MTHRSIQPHRRSIRVTAGARLQEKPHEQISNWQGQTPHAQGGKAKSEARTGAGD